MAAFYQLRRVDTFPTLPWQVEGFCFQRLPASGFSRGMVVDFQTGRESVGKTSIVCFAPRIVRQHGALGPNTRTDRRRCSYSITQVATLWRQGLGRQGRCPIQYGC